MFQSESYFSFRSTALIADDVVVGLGQHVRKNAATCYEAYVTNRMTMSNLCAMKTMSILCDEGVNVKNFKEPNFQQYLRIKLLNFKRCGSYQGYVRNSRKNYAWSRLIPFFDFHQAINEQQPKETNTPEVITGPTQEVITDRFSKVELKRPEENKRAWAGGNEASASNLNGMFIPKLKSISSANSNNSSGKKKCTHCDKSFHHPRSCWVTYPEKLPQAFRKNNTIDKMDFEAKYLALVDQMVIDDVTGAVTILN
ncbi:LOW QUALITY PROTEIN: hypothetical protein PHMEG_00016209 [Phytophthora megakarya]|uniref:Uncharacterized protein n=1 Tax=Phytophthora megakarya TaxID=4795 RepID=A0A225W1Y0_9STRA|nr:LOW QUALITY PROTEIN: hypothetical protein PHMEG_00016209 [Phytophthora megakarya]